jgi:hypothetical protein
VSQGGVLGIASGGGAVTETLTGNSGGPVPPDAGFNINVVGNNTTGINIVGNPGLNTLTVVGIQATTAQRGTVTLATDAQAIAGVDTINVLTSSNLAAKLGTQTAHSLAVFEGVGSPLTALGVATDGQLPIGSTGADPVLATLTAGAGITITNGPGSITISSTAMMFNWNIVAVNTVGLIDNGYIANSAGNIQISLPAGGVLGDEFDVLRNIGGGSWTITQAAGQQIFVANGISSTDPGDAISLICVAANTWLALSAIGNLTVI